MSHKIVHFILGLTVRYSEFLVHGSDIVCILVNVSQNCSLGFIVFTELSVVFVNVLIVEVKTEGTVPRISS